MKYLKQFGIILVLSFIGELLNHVLPLPVPSSIYGIILMFICFKTGLIPLEEVDETGRFLIEIMPLMFIPAAVGLLEAWNIIQSVWLQYLAVTAVSTVFVMAIAGRATQYMIRRTSPQQSATELDHPEEDDHGRKVSHLRVDAASSAGTGRCKHSPCKSRSSFFQ